MRFALAFGPSISAVMTAVVVVLRPKLLQELDANLDVAERDVPGRKYGTRPTTSLHRMQAGSQKPQGTTSPLEGVNSGPPFAHDVNESRMKWVGCPHTVAEQSAFVLCLLALGTCLRCAPLHPGYNLLIRVGNLCGGSEVR